MAVTSNNATLSPAPEAAAPLLLGGESAEAVAPASLVLAWQGPNQAKVGDKISLTLNTQSSQSVRSLGFLVNYDPNVLKAVDVIEGSFLRQGDQPTKLAKVIDQQSGKILIDMSTTSPTGASGSGSVVAIVFEVTRAASQSQITTSQILPVGPAGQTLAANAPPPYAIAVGQ
jgi:general secretion pathway protein D